MQTYLAYARGGKEFEVTDSIQELGISVFCPRKIEFIRRGKKRRPEPVESPALPNYLFIDVADSRFLELMQVKYLASTLTPLSGPDMRSLAEFKRMVEAEYAEAQRIAQNQDAICEYKAGQAVKMMDGGFSDRLLKFKGIVERAHDMHPKLVLEMEMMGRAVKVEADPLNVKAAE